MSGADRLQKGKWRNLNFGGLGKVAKDHNQFRRSETGSGFIRMRLRRVVYTINKEKTYCHKTRLVNPNAMKTKEIKFLCKQTKREEQRSRVS
jgi:hypothetical protein